MKDTDESIPRVVKNRSNNVTGDWLKGGLVEGVSSLSLKSFCV